MAYIEHAPGDTPQSIAEWFAARDGRTLDASSLRIKRRGSRIDAAFKVEGGFLWFHLSRSAGRSWRIETRGRIPHEVESLYSLDEIFA